MVMRFWLVKSAVGGSSASSSSRVSCVGPVVDSADEGRLLADAVAGQRVAVAAQALGRRVQLGAIAQEGDAAMAVVDEVRDGDAGAAGVVGEHDVGVDEARRAVDEDEGDPGRPVALQVAVVGRGGRDDEPVDAPRAERLGQLALALGPLVGAAGEGQHAALAGHVLDAAVHGGEERVGDVLEDQADARRQPIGPAQRAGGQVVAVAEQLDRLVDARRQVGADARPAVDDARDGGEAHAGQRRDLLHRRAPAVPAVGALLRAARSENVSCRRCRCRDPQYSSASLKYTHGCQENVFS